jgi:hypothetical protein
MFAMKIVSLIEVVLGDRTALIEALFAQEKLKEAPRKVKNDARPMLVS